MKNYTAFELKKKKVREFRKSSNFKRFIVLDKEVSIKESIKNPETVKDREPHEYVFSDSDDDYIDKNEGLAEEPAPHLIPKRSKQSKIVFDRSRERRDFYKIAPIKSREELADTKKESPDHQDHTPNPIEDLRASHNKIKKYFSRDVRSGYG